MDFQTALNRFLTLTHHEVSHHFAQHYPNLTPPKFVAEEGSVYVRIVCVGTNNRSAHCFVKKEDGTIWKTASWKAPAKNFPRGNIYDELPKIAIYGY